MSLFDEYYTKETISRITYELDRRISLLEEAVSEDSTPVVVPSGLEDYVQKETFNRANYSLDRRVSILEASGVEGTTFIYPSGLENYTSREIFDRATRALDRRISILERESQGITGKYVREFINETVLTITHNLLSTDIIVQVYKGNDMIIPEDIQILNDSQVRVSMSQAVTGRVVILA